MSYVLQLHQAHQTRVARIASKAIEPKPQRPPAVYMPLMSPILQPDPVKAEAKLGVEPWFYARKPSYLTIVEIQEIVAKYFEVRRADILARRQNMDHVVPRQVAMYLARTTTPHGYLLIGRVFDRDHSTIITGFRKIEKMVKDGNPIARHVVAIEKLISERTL